MSKNGFGQERYKMVMDVPSSVKFHKTLMLIETEQFICKASSLSISCLDQSQENLYDDNSLGLSLMLPDLGENLAQPRRKKTGCTCKKTNCLKMYCECFSTGKQCTPQCSCYGCHNHIGHADHAETLKCESKVKLGMSNRHMNRGCNCKKSQCQKKYCECYNAGTSCTSACNCSDCLNGSCTTHPENPREMKSFVT